MAKVTMTMNKTTINTVQFGEVLTGRMTTPAIGTLYVPKGTLKAMGWKEGMAITVDVSLSEEKIPANAKKVAPKKARKSTKKTATTKKKAATKK